MSAIATNRDLYQFVTELADAHQDSERPLEAYLRALLPRLRAYRGARGLSADDFAALLAAAFDADPAPFDEDWRRRPPAGIGPDETFDAVEAALIAQIVDLREMTESGVLADDQRYFGIDAPRGGRWFNFDPVAFLECGVQGAFGGWDDDEDDDAVDDEDDDAAGDLEPAEIVALGDGELAAAEPVEREPPPVPLEWLEWHAVGAFLACGQYYE